MGKISKEKAVRRKVLFASGMPLEQLSKITNSKSFLWFQKFYKGFSLELKKKGRHDTIHNAPLEQESLKKIQELMITLLKLMRSDKTNIDAADIQPGYKSYQQLKEELPEEYKESLHILLPCMLLWLSFVFWPEEELVKAWISWKNLTFKKSMILRPRCISIKKSVGNLRKITGKPLKTSQKVEKFSSKTML